MFFVCLSVFSGDFNVFPSVSDVCLTVFVNVSAVSDVCLNAGRDFAGRCDG